MIVNKWPYLATSSPKNGQENVIKWKERSIKRDNKQTNRAFNLRNNEFILVNPFIIFTFLPNWIQYRKYRPKVWECRGQCAQLIHKRPLGLRSKGTSSLKMKSQFYDIQQYYFRIELNCPIQIRFQICECQILCESHCATSGHRQSIIGRQFLLNGCIAGNILSKFNEYFWFFHLFRPLIRPFCPFSSPKCQHNFLERTFGA